MSTISTGTLLTTAFKVTSDLSGTLQIQTGASSANAVYIDSSQNVGIGTTSPQAKLHVNGTTRLGNLDFNNTTADSAVWITGSDFGIGTFYGNALKFLTSNTERMRIDSSGNLGIGTSSQLLSAMISVVPGASRNGLAFTMATGYESILTNNPSAAAYTFGDFRQNNTVVGTIAVGTTATSYNTSSTSGVIGVDASTIAFNTASSERMRIDSSGNLGIGLTNPSIRLDVVGASNLSATLIKAQGALPDNNDNAGLYVLHQGTAGTGLRVRTDAALTGSNFAHILVNNASASINGLQVSQYGTGYIASFDKSGTVVFRVDSSGNVGIGTTSPSSYGRLTVNDTAAKSIYVRSSSTNFSGLLLENTNSATKWQIGVEGGAFNTAGLLNIGIDAVGSKMVIDSSGNVGIGTTSPVRKLTVSTNGACEFVLQDTSQAANSRNWRLFNTSNTLYFGTLNDAGNSGTDVMKLTSGANLQFNSGYGSVATAYGCRAWCQYNQSPSIIGAGNITSITVIGTGDVRLNFATAMVDSNYSAVATTNESGGQPKWCNSTQMSTTDIRIVTFNANQSTGWFEYNSVAVFR
jgi:hypothetical protein